MNSLIESSYQIYKGHMIQEMEDFQGLETLYYVDYSKMFFSIRAAKKYVRSIS